MKTNTCNLCGANKIRTLFETRDRLLEIPGTFTVRQCRICSLVFVYPQPSKKELKSFYPSDIYFAYNPEGKEAIFQHIRNYVIKNTYQKTLFSTILSFFIIGNFGVPKFKKKGKILDIGCGTGEVLSQLKTLGWETYGIDIDKKVCEIAKQNGVAHVKHGSFNVIDSYPNNFFDAIRLFHVIEHLDNPAECIRLLQKKLKKGGEFILATPNVDSLLSRVLKSNWPAYDGPRHLFLFSPKTLKAMLEKKHLAVQSIQYYPSLILTGVFNILFSTFFKRKMHLDNLFFVFISYPLEFALAKLHTSDSFIISGIKR